MKQLIVPESSADASVLVVDDERDVADVYALRLSDEFETRTAYSGGAALTPLDDDVDVVLLDRHMPEVRATTSPKRSARAMSSAG